MPVPVWLTLGSWDPSLQGLREWVTATISRDHPYLRATDFGPNAAAQLFDTGRIALFLDGLDEMPDMLRSKAVERLTAEAAGRRLVITSRPDEFRETIDLGRRQLPYTAVIELRPVAPKAAAGYLLEGQIGAARQAWQSVADHVLADPDGVLARTLNTPLTLSLARAAYNVRRSPRVAERARWPMSTSCVSTCLIRSSSPPIPTPASGPTPPTGWAGSPTRWVPNLTARSGSCAGGRSRAGFPAGKSGSQAHLSAGCQLASVFASHGWSLMRLLYNESDSATAS